MTGLLGNEWVTHAVVAAAALAAGYMIGRWERVAQAGKPRRARLGDIARVAFGLLLIGLVVGTYLQGRAVTDCYRSAFSQVIGALAERSSANGAAATAQREFLVAVRDNPTSTGAEIDAYLGAVDQLEATRQATPLPPIPECDR